MAKPLSLDNRWSGTSTVIPTWPVNYADPEKASPALEEAQARGPIQHDPNPLRKQYQPIQNRPISLDWYGSDDPLNPHNWSSVRRWFQTSAISGIALVGTFASSVLSLALEPTAAEFGSPTIIATLAFSIYQLGLAFGGPFAVPLSESFGRKLVVFISLPLFAFFILGTGFARSMPTLVVTRFFAGFFAAPSLSVGSGTLSDLWPPEKHSSPMSMYVAAPFFGFGSPTRRGSHADCWLALDFMAYLILYRCTGDSSCAILLGIVQSIILRRRAKKNGQPLPPAPLEGATWNKALQTYISKTLTRPMHMLFTEPIVAAINTYSAFNFGQLYSFFAAFPQVYREYYGFDSLSTGLTFISVGVGVIIATIVIILFSKKWYPPLVRRAVHDDKPKPSHAKSRLPPEKRLPLAMNGGPCITIGLFMYG
ncbi:major facilitator superfamily transporter [Stagonosporopsis vannaccii]|nr:major facilitator superfamily transporter [Stagonosporopsis vannaccii]